VSPDVRVLGALVAVDVALVVGASIVSMSLACAMVGSFTCHGVERGLAHVPVGEWEDHTGRGVCG